ncbi:MAG TPA: two-component regulator propeller domain-containing protein [Arenimonas sp.]|nr:two-component regulator propeller domain-containing protein [Arenimonas sp.]
MRASLMAVLFSMAALVGTAAAALAPGSTAFRRLGTEQGLSQATAWTMIQDRHGFLWVATQDGLNRFDGHEFRVYRRASHGLAGDVVLALAIDRQQVLWVGGKGGLARYNEAADRFEVVPIDGDSAAQAEVRGLHVDAAGVLWIASYEGLSRYDPAVGKRMAWTFAADQMPPDTRFESLTSDAEGNLWLGSLGGLWRLDPSTGVVDMPYADAELATPLLSTRIDALLFDRSGVLWVGAVAEGVFRFDAATREWRVLRHRRDDPDSLNSDIVRSVMRDSEGQLWVGTREGLNRVEDPDSTTPRVQRYAHHRPDPRSLGAGRVMSLLQARDGSLLAGTYTGGISVLHARGNRFASFTPDRAATRALRDPVVYSLLEDGDDAVWLGGRNGLYRYRADTGELEDFPATAGLGISGMVRDGDDVWMGVLAGARILDLKSGTVRVPPLPQPLAGVQITRLWLEPERVIAGTFDRGIFVLRREDLAPLAHYPIASWVSDIAAFDDDTLVVAASDGLHWLARDGGIERHHHVSGSEPGADLPDGGITQFLRARDGSLWLASAAAGLLRMRLDDPGDPASARFERIPAFAERGFEVVQALAEADDGHLWLSGKRGLLRFDPRSGALDAFGAADGAFDGDYQSRAVARLGDGRMLFAATRGFTVFDPAAVADSPPAAAPLLTELRLWNRRVESRAVDSESPLPMPLHRVEALTLPSSAAGMLSLRFASQELLAPERLRYAYRLDGFDPDWIETNAAERSATYTNLAPGQYVFRVKAGEPGRLDAARVTELPIHILPPWWMTTWARALFVLLALGSLYVAYRWRVHSIHEHRRQLQLEVAERTMELSQAKQRAEDALVELRQTQRELIEAEKLAALGSLVSGIAHEMNTPLGNAVTASTLLGDRARDVQRQFAAGELKRSELAGFLETARDAAGLLDTNLGRTAELVDTFKQLSADQIEDERRRFRVSEHLQMVRHSHEDSWHGRPIDVEIAAAEGLEIDNYPRVLGRVLGQLLQNALTHAFDAQSSGRIRISARELENGRVEYVVEDNGSGIPAEALPHVFEPFYTTRRGQGRSGLGLHVAYNLVTRILGGRIEVDSGEGGTRVRVLLPPPMGLERV